MTKFYGVSCHYPCHQLVCHRLCHQLVYHRLCNHQLWLVVVVVVMVTTAGSNWIKSIVVNRWWRGMAWHDMLDCYIWLCWYIQWNDNNGWHVNFLLEFVVTSVSVSICSAQDIYYTYIPSIYVRLGDAVDYSIIWWRHVGMDDFIHGWGQCNDHLWWCRVRRIIMYRPMNKGLSDWNHMNDNVLALVVLFIIVTSSRQ